MKRLVIYTEETQPVAQLAQAVAGSAGPWLEIGWIVMGEQRTVAEETVSAVQHLCRALQGLKRVTTVGPIHSMPVADAAAWCGKERRRLTQALQQAVVGLDVDVEVPQ